MNSSATEADQREFLLIEAFRGFAAFLVVYTHFWALSPGSPSLLRFAHTGVDLFFVLSGYVFGPYFFGKSIGTSSTFAGTLAFWTRRFFRIYPLYLLALCVYFAEKTINEQDLLYVVEHLSFTFLQSKAMAFYYNPPFWSLPSEISFYLVLPCLVWLLHQAHSIMWRRITLAIVLALALCSRIFLGLSADYEKENQAFILLHHLPGLAIEFIIGALLWAWVRRSDQLLLWPAVLGVIAWLGLAQHFANVGDAGIQASILKGQLGGLAALCYACLMATCIRWVRSARCESVFKADFVICFCQWAGKLSYGTYLFHIAVLRAAQTFSLEYQLAHLPSPEWLALGLTLLLAFLAHRFWEDPCRSLGRRLANAIKA